MTDALHLTPREVAQVRPCPTIKALEGSAASTSPPRSDEPTESASEDAPAPPGPSAAFLARAQEWLGCVERDGECYRHDGAWPCWDARDLAALLAEVAAEAWDEGYRLDWTGGVRHDNPYRTGADQ